MTSGGLGTMGYGFPASASNGLSGEARCRHRREASIMMNIQELSTAIQHRLPVKIFILNNQYMGMVRQWTNCCMAAGLESYTDALPNFVKLAESFGAVGLRTDKPSELDDVIKEMIATDNVVIADIGVDQMENCLPMIPSGSAHNEMILGSEAQSFGKDGVSDAGMVLV